MSLALVLTVAGGVAALAGASLLIRGLRGRRVDDHPCCRRCGFDLHGLDLALATARCPECGRDLGAKSTGPTGTPQPGGRSRAVRIGRRVPNLVVAWIGVLLLVVLALPAGLLAGLLWSGADPDRYKPVWWLLHDAGSANETTARRSKDELRRRMVMDEISSRDVRAIARQALVRQAGPESGWHQQWGTLFEIAWIGGWLDEDMTAQYLKNAVRYRVVAAKPPAIPNESIQLDLAVDDRTGDLLRIMTQVRLVLPESGEIRALTLGQFNVWGPLGEGKLGLLPYSSGTPRPQWFDDLGVATSAAAQSQMATTYPGLGFTILTPGAGSTAVNRSIRVAPWPSSWSGQLPTTDEASATVPTQSLTIGPDGLSVGTAIKAELWTWAPTDGRGSSTTLTSWWSRFPVQLRAQRDGTHLLRQEAQMSIQLQPRP